MGAFEVAAQYAASRMPITVLYRRPKVAWLEPLMRAGRERANVRLLPADVRGVRKLFKALERGEAVLGEGGPLVVGEQSPEALGRSRPVQVHITVKP